MSSPDPSPVTLHNTVGDTVPVVTDDQGNMRAVPPNGRLVVAAGQIIASAWGNTTYDQSFMTFANAADRTNQWPVPNEGGLSFLMDSRTPWIYRAGAWRGLPLGFMAAASGPANQVNTSGLVSLASVNFPCGAGRAYRISAYLYGTLPTSGSTGVYRIRPQSSSANAPVPEDVVFAQLIAPAANTVMVAAGVALFQPATTYTATAQLMAHAVGANSVQVAANAGTILVEDIGA